MPAVLAFTAPGRVAWLDEPERPLGPRDVRVRTLLSGISAGTELTAYRGTNPYQHARWDAHLRVFLPDPEHADAPRYPEIGWGYEEVGEVVEAGPEVADLPPGTLVAGAWGHRAETVLPAERARVRRLPPGTDPLLGVFSQIGAIALNGVLDGALRLGETAAVFGLGVVGQLLARLAVLSGADVLAVDLLELRLAAAQAAGIGVLDGRAGDAALEIRRRTDGRGADVCFETAGSTRALQAAIRACAYSARVVALGFYQGEALGLRLGDEFHHNRVALICSQISGVAPELRYRWDEARLAATFLRLCLDGRLDPRPLVTHLLPAREAAAAFALLDERPQEALQVVLDFRTGAGPVPAAAEGGA